MKKLIYGVLTVTVFIVWVIYSYIQPPILKGQSSDGKWEYTYYPALSIKELWEGKVKWNGKSLPTVKTTKLIIDGKVAAESPTYDKKILDNKNSFEFASFGSRPEKKSTYDFSIEWKEGKKEFQESFTLKPQKRYFVIPNFLANLFHK
jgi:hypothetical protein